MSEFKVEKGISLPTNRTNSRYPWDEMDVGDSILFPGFDMNKIAPVAHAWGKRNGAKFSARTVDGGVRIWRIS